MKNIQPWVTYTLLSLLTIVALSVSVYGITSAQIETDSDYSTSTAIVALIDQPLSDALVTVNDNVLSRLQDLTDRINNMQDLIKSLARSCLASN